MIFLIFLRALRTRVALFSSQTHQRAHHIDLLTALKCFTCRIVCRAALASGQDFCSTLRSRVGALPQIRKRQVAEKRQRKRTRNRRCRKIERIRRRTLPQQTGALLNAETLLFIDDAQAACREHNIGLNDRMRTEQYLDFPCRKAPQNISALRSRRGTRENRPRNAHPVKQAA